VLSAAPILSVARFTIGPQLTPSSPTSAIDLLRFGQRARSWRPTSSDKPR